MKKRALIFALSTVWFYILLREDGTLTKIKNRSMAALLISLWALAMVEQEALKHLNFLWNRQIELLTRKVHKVPSFFTFFIHNFLKQKIIVNSLFRWINYNVINNLIT